MKQTHKIRAGNRMRDNPHPFILRIQPDSAVGFY